MAFEEEKAAIAKFKNTRVAVLGDLMLDVYLWGSVSRISPEAPVPVVGISKRSCCLGGAANVMRNIAGLGGHAFAFGVIGRDPAGVELVAALDVLGIDSSTLCRLTERRTTEKCRVMAGAQQLLRADFEETVAVDEKVRAKMVRKICAMIRAREVDAVIFDDYAKGVLASWMLEKIIAVAAKAGVITFLDPKPKAGGVAPVRGLSVLKPNRGEAFAMAGIPDPGSVKRPEDDAGLRRAAEKIMEIWEPEYLLVSLAAQGMALFDAKGLRKVIPTLAREVFDVSGAGDTVAATCTLALASGCGVEKAAEIANRAAGVVVGKVGTAPINYEELIAAFDGGNR